MLRFLADWRGRDVLKREAEKHPIAPPVIGRFETADKNNSRGSCGRLIANGFQIDLNPARERINLISLLENSSTN